MIKYYIEVYRPSTVRSLALRENKVLFEVDLYYDIPV